MADLTLKHNGNTLPQVTISFGLAIFPDDVEKMSDLINAANNALYNAKNIGRNRVVLYDNLK